MTENIEVIEQTPGDTQNFKELIQLLDQLGISITLDFIDGEITFFLSDKEQIVFDFVDFSYHLLDFSSYVNFQQGLGIQLPDYLVQETQKLSEQMDTTVEIIGEGHFQHLVIQVFGQFILINKILVDIDDIDPIDPDPNDGEPVSLETGSLLL